VVFLSSQLLVSAASATGLTEVNKSLFIGVLTDNSTSKWGRRRPALAVGCLLCALSMLILGFARPIASIFTSIEPAQTNLTIAAVVFSIFAIDFSVNAVCALDRTLILDLVHSSQQSLANVWAARLSGMGAILGFFIGQNDLTRLAPFTWLPSIFASGAELDSSEAQLRCVCVLVVVLLLSTHVVTMIVAKESPALPNPSHRMRDSQSNWQLIVVSMILAWTGLVKVARGLSRPILELFRAQFFLAMAWFPFS
jgi:solute carrier family 45 protein 1/2/4